MYGTCVVTGGLLAVVYSCPFSCGSLVRLGPQVIWLGGKLLCLLSRASGLLSDFFLEKDSLILNYFRCYGTTKNRGLQI